MARIREGGFPRPVRVYALWHPLGPPPGPARRVGGGQGIDGERRFLTPSPTSLPLLEVKWRLSKILSALGWTP